LALVHQPMMVIKIPNKKERKTQPCSHNFSMEPLHQMLV
jgi:hypothetical protein